MAALTDDYDTSYEAVNLLARHNIPFRVLRSSNVKPADLSTYQVVITFASPNKNETEAILAYAQQGGVAVLVNQPGPLGHSRWRPKKWRIRDLLRRKRSSH